MNIKILDSWLRDYLKTDATPKQIAESLSLTSVGIERITKWKQDYLYDIEVTTNRPDLASVVGIAREAGAVLPQFGYKAHFTPPVITTSKSVMLPARRNGGSEVEDLKHSIKDSSLKAQNDKYVKLEIQNDPKLVNRLCAVVIDVTMKDSPQEIKDRLESSDIRSLNAIVDITNYVMRTIGYPAHVFDYDRLATKKLTIREAKKGEEIVTLDGKTHTLPGGDVVAVDTTGRIVDLLGIMGLENSVVNEKTKRIVLFINNDNPLKIRKTSMHLGIRTEAAQLNEKKLDPELVMEALLYGISLYQKLAGGKVVSEIIDIYPNKPSKKTVEVSQEHIQKVLGVDVPLAASVKILELLGFEATVQGDTIRAEVPSFRLEDVSIPEDLIEEIARVYGYQNIPNALPPIATNITTNITDDPFFWETRVKQAMKYWGYTEVYTYPMVSEVMYEGETSESVKLSNPLGDEFLYMRNSLVPSLLTVVEANKKIGVMKIFEIGNVYQKNGAKLPLQLQHFAAVICQKNASFFELKGLIEQLAQDLGITDLTFRSLSRSGLETEILVKKQSVGTIEILDENLINVEFDFTTFTKSASLHKTFTPLQKYPPIFEDISLIIDEDIPTGEILESIKEVSRLIVDVSLLDKYQLSRTFHITYQSTKKNLTSIEVKEIREKILEKLHKSHNARLKV